MEKSSIALLVAAVPAASRQVVFASLRKQGQMPDQTLDRGFRGNGNAALRRMGIEPRTSCECVVCVVYGGDCAYQMWEENRSQWHRDRRGIKTKGQ